MIIIIIMTGIFSHVIYTVNLFRFCFLTLLQVLSFNT